MGYNDDSATHVPASQGPRVDGSRVEHKANEATEEPASRTEPWDGNRNDAKKISVNPQNDSGPATQTKPPALAAASPSTMPHSTMPNTNQMAPNITHKLPENQGGVVIGYIVLPTDLTQYRELRKPVEESKAEEQTGAKNTGAISTVPYGIQYPSNDQKKSAEPQKPSNGSQYPSTEPNMSRAPVKTNDRSQYPSSDLQMSTQPNKPSNGNHNPNELIPKEPVKQNNGCQCQPNDQKMSTQLNKPSNGSQYPSNDLMMSNEPRKPNTGSPYQPKDRKMSNEPNKPNNGYLPNDLNIPNEPNKPNHGIQYPSDDPKMSTNPKKPSNGSQYLPSGQKTSGESNKQNNQHLPTTTTPEMTRRAIEKPDPAQIKPQHGNTPSGGAGVTAKPGSNRCRCAIL